MHSQNQSTNWHGSFDTLWKNHETGETIEFRHTNNAIEIWVCSNNIEEPSSNTPRRQRFDTKETRADAIERAHEIADRFNTTRWWK